MSAAACTSGSKPQPKPPQVSVSGLPTSRSLQVSDSGPGQAPGPGIAFLSDVYSLTPGGTLPNAVTVHIPLQAPVPTGSEVVIASRETPDQAWTYLPASLSADRRSVTFSTSHFSFFGVLGYDLGQAIAAFKSDFVDGIDGGLTQTVTRPKCASEQSARGDGYSVSSTSGDTVFWCFGLDSSGHRVLKITDRRRYPLEISHAGLTATPSKLSFAQWASLSQLDAGRHVIVAPTGTATFSVSLPIGASVVAKTDIDALGQSLYALQTGVTTLVEILTRFGAGSGIKAVDIADKMLTAQSCLGAIGKGSGSLISGCFSAKEILDAFGVKGLLIAPIMVAGPVVAFFDSQWNALIDNFNGHSRYRVTISRQPTLAAFTGPWYGHTRQLTVSSSGVVSEYISDGCCSPVIRATLQLSNPRLSGNDLIATATLVSVHPYQEWLQYDGPVPKVGATGTVRIHDGILTEPFTKDTIYCDDSQEAQGSCGA